MTEIGSPSAAHTLLKLTPAAITRTTTSKAPGCGVSISSSWKASTGSPRRSSRITHAVIVSGSVPGSVATLATWLTSTATRHLLRFQIGGRKGANRTCTRTVAYSVQEALAAKPHVQRHAREERSADAEHEKRPQRADVQHEPAEVLTEEAGQRRDRQEHRRDERQLLHHDVEAVRDGREVHVHRPGQQVAVGVDQVRDADQVVVDVAEVVARAGREPGQVLDLADRAGREV